MNKIYKITLTAILAIIILGIASAGTVINSDSIDTTNVTADTVTIDPDNRFTSSHNDSPLLIWRCPSSTNAGEAGGMFIELSTNHDGTPGANDLTGATVRVTNDLMISNNLWGLDVVVQQGQELNITPDPVSGTQIRGIEVEVMNGANVSTFESSPFAGNAGKLRSNGIEIIGINGSSYYNTAGLMLWANNDSGAQWWYDGIALSRVVDDGITFNKLSGDNSQEPFSGSIFNMSSLNVTNQSLILAPTGQNTNFKINNSADYELFIDLSCGDTAESYCGYRWLDRGDKQWELYKNTGNDLVLANSDYDVATMAFTGNFTQLPVHTGAIASAATINIEKPITHISGTSEITTITFTGSSIQGMSVYFIPDAAFTLNTGGNIGKASTAVLNQSMTLVYDGSYWFPSY